MVASAIAVMQKLHSLAQPILYNLSHALELPWEKYLSDMHEFHVTGQDELRIVAAGSSIPQEWSTLVSLIVLVRTRQKLPSKLTYAVKTLVLPLDNPREMSVVFGEALSVFSDGTIPSPSSPVLSADMLPEQTGRGWIVYHLRPSDDVLYTRTAGALMKPLSASEYETVPRVRDLHGVLLKGAN